ncbi:uncharacterized protein C8R40DRAFT_97816 [Lentinula edodes]|uniref:uncharacterized protein n=1 Tax=Lentinula edodes TaxID=5353 RepID=UPI001E8EAC9E|nr:uncharacterized protein C8R40DRAFT_97816 [Lentinula edodes]KAH7877144.1 hypothetical protein C8R40DRAFT_97816 [Lentinula edodes]
MKCSSAASALILASLSISAFETYAAPVSILDQNIPSVPSTPSTPNPVPFPPFLPREEHTNSAHTLAVDTSTPLALEIHHFPNRERYPRADDADSGDVEVDKPPRSSRKSSKKTTEGPPEDPAKFVVTDPQAKKSSRKSSKDANERKSTNTHRHKKTHKSDPPVDAETIKSPIENSLDIQSQLSSPAPVIRKRPKKSKPSAQNVDESLTTNESFEKSSTKPSSLTLSATSQRTHRKPKPKPIPPKPKKPNSDGYFYAQNTTAAFNSASSSSATNANAFAVNDGNIGGGNVPGIVKPPGM